MKINVEELKQLDLEDLLNLLSPSFYLAKTFYPEPSKQYVIRHLYDLIAEVNLDENGKFPDVNEWETFGYPVEHLHLAMTPETFGHTAKLALINFFVKYPEHLTVKE